MRAGSFLQTQTHYVLEGSKSIKVPSIRSFEKREMTYTKMTFSCRQYISPSPQTLPKILKLISVGPLRGSEGSNLI